MSSAARLVILMSADPTEFTAPLNDNLADWCESGLLGEVVWLCAQDLATHLHNAECWANRNQAWQKTTLAAAMSQQFFGEVWLAALRHPHATNEPTLKEAARHAEEQAHSILSQMVGTDSNFRSFTVKIARETATSTAQDCTPVWDFHLIHDAMVATHSNLPKVSASASSPLSLCAIVALCAAGGWRNVDTSMGIDSDVADGVFKPVRFVRCQLRVLHTPLILGFAIPSATPTAPPWPLPQVANVQRAHPDAVPPLALATDLAQQSGLVCRQPPTVPTAGRKYEFARLWKKFAGSIPAIPGVSKYERALHRLADRTGGTNQESKTKAHLQLAGTSDFSDLVLHVRRSDFPPLLDSSSGFIEAEDSWKNVRDVMFGLVDGSELIANVNHPVDESKSDPNRLLWTDPQGLAPEYSPRDATDVWPDSNTDEDETDEEELVFGDPQRPKELPHKDTLMERLTETLRQAIAQAQQNFIDNCAIATVDDHYDQAKSSQRKARVVGAVLSVVTFISLLLMLDQRWPTLAGVIETITPFGVPRSDWGIGSYIIILLALLGGLIWFGKLFDQMLEERQQLESIYAQRHRLGIYSSHYAAELLRLWGVGQQYADHRLIITEFLHRPFGNVVANDGSTLKVSDLPFRQDPPAAMLVTCADVNPRKLPDIHRHNQKTAVAPKWLNEAYGRVYSIWKQSFHRRVVGEFLDPDHDITARNTVIHKNRRDGSDLFGARTEFSTSVVGASGFAETGWALRQASDERTITLLEQHRDKPEDLLAAFGNIRSVHGAYPGISAEEFFSFSHSQHELTWRSLLAANTKAPQVNILTSKIGVVPTVADKRSLILAWQMVVSDPVRPQAQAGWQQDTSEQHPPTPHKSIV